jgi:hypothetical protein
MIEDMAARKLNPHTQRSHIQSCKRFAETVEIRVTGVTRVTSTACKGMQTDHAPAGRHHATRVPVNW